MSAFDPLRTLGASSINALRTVREIEVVLFQFALAMSAAATSTPDWKQSPLALGAEANVAVAEKVARQCGMKHIFQTYYKDGKAMLWMEPGNDKEALACIEKWLADHENSFDPLLGVE